MKRIVTCVVIMAVAVCFSLYAFDECKKTSDGIKSDIASMLTALEDDDFATAVKYADSAELSWEHLSFGTVFVEDTECDNEIIMTLANIRSMCESEDEDIKTECERLYRLLDTFVNRQRVTWENVF